MDILKVIYSHHGTTSFIKIEEFKRFALHSLKKFHKEDIQF